MAEVKEYRTMVLPRATALYVDLFKPRAYTKDGKPKGKPTYNLTHLFNVEQEGVAEGLKEAKAMALKACQDEWPGRDCVAAIKAGEIGWPFKDGNALKKKRENVGKNGDAYANMQVLKSNSAKPPGVVGIDRKEIIDEKEIYDGMIVRTEVNFKAGDVDGNYVKAYLNFVMKVANGPRIGGRSATSVFDGIEEAPDSIEEKIDF